VPARVRWNGKRYRVMQQAGPWRISGEWWDVDGWACDEWDVALDDGTLCRIAHDALTGGWTLDAVYD
jgi:protein ImuB